MRMCRMGFHLAPEDLELLAAPGEDLHGHGAAVEFRAEDARAAALADLM